MVGCILANYRLMLRLIVRAGNCPGFGFIYCNVIVQVPNAAEHRVAFEELACVFVKVLLGPEGVEEITAGTGRNAGLAGFLVFLAFQIIELVAETKA